MQNILPIKTVITKTFKLVFKKEYLSKFVIIGTILSLVTYLSNLIFNYFINLSINQFPPFLIIISLILSVFLYLYFFSFALSFIYNFCLDISIETVHNVKYYITKSSNTSFLVLSSLLIFSLITFAGIILLFIPAIIWGVKYFFTPMISALEGKKTKEALKESKMLVKGYFWQILFRLIVFYLVSSFPGIILSSISPNLAFIQPFFLPITSLFYVVLFNNLRYKNQNNQQPLQNV
ncbi:MAG: hypothetical protein ABIJ05_04845 [Patescibacteria group bacterium]